jgi:hypothetical protein
MKSVLFLVVIAAALWTSSLPKTINRLSEFQVTMEPDSMRSIETPGKGVLEPSDNLIDTVLTLPRKHFALLQSNDILVPPSKAGMSLVRSEV